MTPPLNDGNVNNAVTWRRFLPLFRYLFKNSRLKTTGASYFALLTTLKDLQSRFIILAGVILAVAAGAPLPLIGVIFSHLIDAFPPTEEEINQRIKQLLSVACAYFIITWGWAFCWGIVGARISRVLRTSMVDRALGLDETYYETQCPDITSRLTADAQTVQAGTAEKVGLFLQSISYFIIAFVVGFTLNARLTGILFAAVIPSMVLVIYTGTTVLSQFSKDVAESTTEASIIAEGAIKAVQVVQAFGAFEVLTNDHEDHLKKAMNFGIKKAVAGAILLGGVFFIAYAANALAFWQGSVIVSNGSGGAGTVYAIVFLILDASFVIGQAGPFIQSFSQAASAGHRIFSLINHPKIPIDVYADDGVRADEYTLGLNKRISLESVSFVYPARPLENVLNSVNLEITTGTTIGIVGASGSGKSTIAALLMRFYDPTQGTISINGIKLTDFNLSSIRRHIALVDQDPAIFSGTIYTNIKDGYRGPELPEENIRDKCIEAAKAADAWSFIELLPEGLETLIGEPSGTKLSGGQKQRLCLARALVGDPLLLILDEATSALDTISEASILASLARLRSTGHRTTIMIAHRLASVKNADSIVVMGKGEVLEQGDHDSLLSNEGGAYRQLIEAQMFSHDEESETSIVTSDTAFDPDLLREEEKISPPVPEKPENITTSQSYDTFTVIKRCLSLCHTRLFFTLCALLGSLMTGSLILGESIIFGHLVELLNGTAPSGQVNFFCLMFFALSLIALLGYVMSGSCFGIASEHLIFRTRDISLQTILRQDMEWFLQPAKSTSALVSIISMDSGHLSGLSGVIIGTIVSALVSVIGGAILAHIVAWKIAIVLFATSPVVVLAGFARLRVLARLEEKNQLAYTEAATLATEACSSVRTIAALGIEKSVSARFHLAVDKYRMQTFRHTALGNALLAFALSITYFVYALAYWWGSKLVRSGEYTSLQFFIVLPAILFSAQAAGQIFSLSPDIGRAKGAASRVFALHDQRPSIDRGTKEFPPSVAPSGAHLSNETTLKGSVVLQNVDLTYDSRPEDPVFKDLNLMIRAGETVALVGRSGAGKTSIISLIERFYDPKKGAILVDGVDIRTVPVSQHRARISLVAQEPDLFSGTVAFNVSLGAKPGYVATREEVIKACQAVGIHEFMTSLPDGYETQCGNNGSQLSGGQKQRIAIARAYIRNPEILLLDEATSALDSQSELQIQEAIKAVSSKRTTIMIAHRLTTVQKADRILVFDHGRIVEEGRHEELLKNGGIYEKMVKVQNLG